MKRQSLSSAVMEYVRTHPGAWTPDIVKALQPRFPNTKRKTLQSVPSGLKFRGRLRTEPGSGYYVVNRLKTTFANTDEIVSGAIDAPLDLAAIPNYMGINLCSVKGLSWSHQTDGQLVSLTIHFIPEQPTKKRLRSKKQGRH